jgi:hypothetical protein
VRSSAVASPCVEAVGQAWAARGGGVVTVEAGGLRDDGRWDVLVGSSVEINRALEGGDAVLDSDLDIAHIPWVLRLSSGGDVQALADVVQSGAEVVIPAGPASYEARRALAEAGAAHVLETEDPGRLRSAAVALVPLSLAGPGRLVEADVRPIRVGAAVGMRSRRADEARAFVSFLGSEDGQNVFAACGAPAPPQ